MSNLVLLKGNDIFTNSLAIAEGTENKHRSVQRIIDKHLESLEKFGRVRFEITPLETKGGIQDVKVYLLNEEQATFLITLFRNNGMFLSVEKGHYEIIMEIG